MKNPLHSEKIGVWCGMSPAAHNWFHLLRCNRHKAAYIYTEIFNTFVNQPEDVELSIGYFHQDGATSHPSHAGMAEIKSFYGNRVISKGIWPPRSHDLKSPDCFFWGYLKGRVYQSKPRTTDALKANITEEFQEVTADVLARTFQNMARWVQSCLDANGGHFQHML